MKKDMHIQSDPLTIRIHCLASAKPQKAFLHLLLLKRSTVAPAVCACAITSLSVWETNAFLTKPLGKCGNYTNTLI